MLSVGVACDRLTADGACSSVSTRAMSIIVSTIGRRSPGRFLHSLFYHSFLLITSQQIGWKEHLGHYLQGAPIKNNPLEKMLYFSHDSTDLSQTFRLRMRVFIQHIQQILLK